MYHIRSINVFAVYMLVYLRWFIFASIYSLSLHKSWKNRMHAEIKAPLHVFMFQQISQISVCFVSPLFLSHQRQAKYSENKLKSIKARNEYLLTLEATNASIFKYYIHDLSDLIDVSTGEWKGGSGILPQTKKLCVTSRTVIIRVSNWPQVCWDS